MMKKLLSLLLGISLSFAGLAQNDGDYQSQADGAWTTPSIWQIYSGGTWSTATVSPDPADLILITIHDDVTIGISSDIDFDAQMVINDGGSLTPSSVTGTPTVTFNNVLIVYGVLSTEYLSTVVDVTIGNTGIVNIYETGTVTVTGALANTVDTRLSLQSSVVGTGSLIHGSGSPAAKVERHIPMSGWHFVSPSTSGVTPQNFFIDTDNSSWLTKWDEATGTWSYFVDPLTESLPLGSGYSYWWENSPAKEMTTPGTVEFKGNLLDPTDDLTVTLTHNGTTDDAAGFNLVGNPWPCAISVDPDLVNDLTNCELSIWIWNNDEEWFEWAAVGTATGSNNNPLEMFPADIAAGQGVYLRALTGGGSVLFNGSARSHDPGTTFWKNAEEEDVNPLIQLLLTKNDKTDRSYIMFGENGTTGFENGIDVSKMFGNEENSYVFLNEEDHKYTQSFLSPLEITEERMVNVYVRAGSEGEHTFAVNMEYLPNTLVVLEDTETGILTEMNNDVVYTFDAKPGDAENRFKLHFTYGVTGIENPGAEKTNVDVYAYNKVVYITNKENNYETAQVSIYDMYGREVYKNQITLENLTRIPVDINNSYLVVRVTNGSDTYTEKVFIK